MQHDDVWAAPAPTTTTLPAQPGPRRWWGDARVFGWTVAVTVLLGAPVGLLWSAIAPRYTVRVTDNGLEYDNLESTKAFVGADGTYVVVMLVAGVLCGLLAWRLIRRSGPWAVAALVVGGILAALVAGEVGLRPGAPKAIAALQEGSSYRGEIDLFLGQRGSDGELSLRADWAFVFWPLGSLVAFLVPAYRRPEEVD